MRQFGEGRNDAMSGCYRNSGKSPAAALLLALAGLILWQVPTYAQGTGQNFAVEETPDAFEAIVREAMATAETASDRQTRLDNLVRAGDAYRSLTSFLQGRGQANAERAVALVAGLDADGITRPRLIEETADAYTDNLVAIVSANPLADYRSGFIDAIGAVLDLPEENPTVFVNYVRLARAYYLNNNDERTIRMLRSALLSAEGVLGAQDPGDLAEAAALSGGVGAKGTAILLEIVESEMPQDDRVAIFRAWGSEAELAALSAEYVSLAELIDSGARPPLTDLPGLAPGEDYRAAFLAALYLDRPEGSDFPVLELSRFLAEKGRISQSLRVARAITDGTARAAQLHLLAEYLLERGYTQRGAGVLQRAYEDAVAAGAADLSGRLVLTSLRYGTPLRGGAGVPDPADITLPAAGADLARAIHAGRQGELSAVRDYLRSRRTPEEDKAELMNAIAGALAGHRQGDMVAEIVRLAPSTAYEAVAESAARKCHFAKRREAKPACTVLATLLPMESAGGMDRINIAISLMLKGGEAYQPVARKFLAESGPEASDPRSVLVSLLLDEAADLSPENVTALTAEQPTEGRRTTLYGAAVYSAYRGKTAETVALISLIDDVEPKGLRDQAYADAMPILLRAGDILPALEAARELRDDRMRMVLYREMAYIRALVNDKYELLAPHSENDVLEIREDKSIMSGDIPLSTAENTEFFANDGKPRRVNSGSSLFVYQDSGSVLDFSKVKLPDMVTEQEQVRARVPVIDPGLMDVSLMRYNGYNSDFFEAVGETRSLRDLYVERQRQTEAQVMFINYGVFDLASLDELADKAGLPDAVEVQGNGEVIIRRPILIGPEATLVMSGLETSAVYLSTEDAAFIVNTGQLYILDTDLMAFNASSGELSTLDYAKRYEFRPFITSWSESGTWITNSVIFGLGYSGAKSYGITLSAGPTIVTKNAGEKKAPVGAIIDNSLIDMYYGYYTYEAEHVDLIGNEYRENVIYGVDPHDRSKDLRIAYNTAYGTLKKHGIIVSREVDESYIIGNISFSNKGSGFMIDRDSTGNLVYANEAYANKQDGITVFESACTLIAANRFDLNKRSGIKIRNSWDVVLFDNEIKENRGGAIESYISILKETDAAKTRDFELDPYTAQSSFAAYKNHLQNNGYGFSARDTYHYQVKDNEFIYQDKGFEGDAKEWEAPLRAGNYGKGAAVQNACRPVLPDQDCRWLRTGVFRQLLDTQSGDEPDAGCDAMKEAALGDELVSGGAP